MESLTSFEESFTAPDGDIIKEINEIPTGSELSQDGACRFFYDQIAVSGSTFLFIKDDAHLICYADHDDVLENLEQDNCKFFIQNSHGRTVIMLINRNSGHEINIPLTFKHETQRDRQVLGLVKKTATLNVCFLAIAYGKLFKEKLHEFKIPEDVTASIPG